MGYNFSCSKWEQLCSIELMTSGFCTGCTIKSELPLPLGQKAMGPGIYNMSGALKIGASFNSTVLICLFWKKKMAELLIEPIF